MSGHILKGDIVEAWRAVALARILAGDEEGAARARQAARRIESRDGWKTRHDYGNNNPPPRHSF